MVKMVALVRRKAGVGEDEFHAHWREHHGPLVARTLGHHVVRYEQNHRLRSSSLGAGDYDGAAVFWFQSPDDFTAMIGDPAYAEHVWPDEETFLDRDAIVWLMTDDAETFVDGGRPCS